MTRPQIPPHLRAQMEGPAYLGPSTFSKVVGISEESELDSWQPDFAIVGATSTTSIATTGV